MLKSYYVYFYYLLTAEAKATYRLLYESLLQLQEEVIVKGSMKNISSIIEYLLMDHPKFYYVDQSNQYFYKKGTTLVVKWNYLYDKANIKKYNLLLDKRLQKSRQILSGKTAYEKTEIIYRNISNHVTYDLNSQFRDNLIGAYINRRAVCHGIATLFKVWCDYNQIPCIMVQGYGAKEAHMWNMVKIEGCFYHVDVTWDIVEDGGATTYFYLNRSDDYMKFHHSWSKAIYPSCLSESTYFQQHHLVLDDMKNWKQLCTAAYKKSELCHFQLTKRGPSVENVLQYFGRKTSFRYIMDDNKSCLMIDCRNRN